MFSDSRVAGAGSPTKLLRGPVWHSQSRCLDEPNGFQRLPIRTGARGYPGSLRDDPHRVGRIQDECETVVHVRLLVLFSRSRHKTNVACRS